MKRLKEKRMKSYVNRGNSLLQEGKQKEAMNMVADGLKYYSNNIINGNFVRPNSNNISSWQNIC